MRVLHVHSGNLYGGVETFLATLARCRDLAPSMETTVALCFDGLLGPELRIEGIATPLLGGVRLRRPGSVWRARRQLASLLSIDRFDVVVCHQAWPLAIFGPIIKAAGVPLVSWVHTAQDGRHWLDRLAARVRPDCVICNSRFTAAIVPHAGARIEYVYYPVRRREVDANARSTIRRELNTQPEDVVIIQVSRMEALKGQATCIESLGLLRDQPNWVCWQIGGAQRPSELRYFESLQRSAARHGVSNRIRFAGHRTDVPNLLAAADVYCQPNLAPDAFGISFVEAMAAGLPIVTSAIGGAREIVDESCGILTPPGDAHALAEALSQLVGNRSERERLGRGGPARASALCDPTRQMRRIVDLLADVSSSAGTGEAPLRRPVMSSSMRLAVFSYGLPVRGKKRGGIERAAHTLAQGLAERGHHVVVFSHDEKPEGATYDVRELPWRGFVNTWLGRRLTMGYLGNLLAMLPDYRGFDAIIAYGDSLLLPLNGPPVVRVMAGSALGEAMHATSVGRVVLQLGVYLQELATALVENTVGISENTRRFNPFVREVIPLGVDSTIFCSKGGEKSPEPSLIFVGTEHGRKRGGLLLNIFQDVVRPAFPDATLMFVGPRGASLPGVSYHTGVSDEELAALYRRAWVYASPSTYEGFGLPYLEAMACGTAVIATPNPGSCEVLGDGAYGRLAGDAEFGRAILALLNNEHARRRWEASGALRAQQFSLSAMIDRYEALLAKSGDIGARRIASA